VNSVVTYETAELGLLMDDDDDILQDLIESDTHDYVDIIDGDSDGYRDGYSDGEIQKDGVADNYIQNNDSGMIDDGDDHDNDNDGEIDESFRDKYHHHHEYEKHRSYNDNNNNNTTIQLQNMPLQPIVTTTIQAESFNKNHYNVHKNTSKPKIRIGFLSRFLIAHPAGILVQGLIKILFHSRNLIKSYRKGRRYYLYYIFLYSVK
jgi:hypothetical protein